MCLQLLFLLVPLSILLAMPTAFSKGKAASISRPLTVGVITQLCKLGQKEQATRNQGRGCEGILHHRGYEPTALAIMLLFPKVNNTRQICSQ